MLSMKKHIVCELTAITIYTVSSFFSVCTAAGIQNGRDYYNLLLDDEKVSSSVKDIASESSLFDTGKYFSGKSTVKDVLDCKEFSGFAELLVPKTDKKDLNVHLNEFQKLMPYHHNVTVKNTVESLDYLYETVKRGEQVFYPIYTSDCIKDNKSLKDTGIFYFRGKKNAPFALILSGGYYYKSLIHEGFPLALKLSHAGYNAFVLSYRQKKSLYGSLDLIKAVNFIINNHRMFGVSKSGFSLWGASSGAQVIISAIHATNSRTAAGLRMSEPAVNIYTSPISFYATKEDPPTFIVVGENDKIVNKTVLKSSAANLNNLHIKAKYAELPRLEHGFGLGLDTDSTGNSNWINSAIAFWEDNKNDLK